MVWQRTQTWDEAAFVGQALPELTNAMGLHLVLNDLDHYHEADTDFSLVDPSLVAQLRADWLSRALACFPTEWHQAISDQVASAENFYLALVSHLDQVRFSVRPPGWIRVLRWVAIGLALATALAIVFAVIEPFGAAHTHSFVVTAELLPIGVAVFGLASALGREQFRANRALLVSDRVRQELRGAISHAFGRPISQFAADMDVLKELSLD